MIDLGLTASQQEAYEAALISEQRLIRVGVTVRDRDEKPITTLSAPGDRVLGGSVQVDATADVSRSLNLTLLDPDHRLRFDPDNPADGAVYADNFISVEYGVYVPDLADWIDCPVFWGPVTKLTRDGATVELEGQGKESLALDPHFATHAYQIPHGIRLDDAIKKVMRQVGERRFSLPNLNHRLHGKHGRAVLPNHDPWKVLTGGLQASKGGSIPALMALSDPPRYLYYNGRGQLTAKRRNAPAVYTFGGEHVTSPAKFAYDVLEFRNTVTVTGGVPKGLMKDHPDSKRRVRATVSLPASHPLSPQRLARNGEPRYMTEFVEAGNLHTVAKCHDRAEHELNAKSQNGVEAEFEALPIPHLEEYDQVTLKLDVDGHVYNLGFQLKKFTIPLASSDAMSVGFNKNVRYRRKHHKRKGHR